MGGPNVLLLDEPTNDLDIATLTILEDFIDDFNGPVIAVSHDRYFLDRICNKIFSYEGEGKIEGYNGNYEDYLSTMVDKKSSTPVEGCEKKEKTVSRDRENKKEKPLKFSFKEQREFEEIDQVIEELENSIGQLDQDIEKNAADFVKLQELLKEKEHTEKLLEEKYDRWTYLNELNEAIENSKK